MPLSHETCFLATLIQKCTCVTSLKKARQLHALILTSAAANPHSPYLYNNLITMYARCGSVVDSYQVFDKMPHRNLVSFNALITAYSRVAEFAVSALSLATQLQVSCFRPNGVTFTSLFQACSSVEDRLVGSLLHAQVVKLGFLDDRCVQTSLLGMYSKFGDLGSAEKVFRYINEKDAIAWNSMILGNLKNGNVAEGFCLFGEMLVAGIAPTQFTYSMMLNACSRVRDHSRGKLIHAWLTVSGTLVDLPLQNVLLDMYCNSGDVETAYGLFKRIENPDLVSWNSMITGYSVNGNGEKATSVYVLLWRRSIPKPDEYTFAAIISATSASLACDYGTSLHAQVIKAGCHESVFVASTLVSMYFKMGETLYAHQVFDMISEKDVVLWTEMIIGHSKIGNGETALRLFSRTCQEGHKMDSFALCGTLGACAQLTTLKQGEMIHSYVVKIGCSLDMSVLGSLVDMYSKNGNLQAARFVFSQAPNPDLKCWNAMLGAYGYHGMAEAAFDIFNQILSSGLRPDEVTFLSLLSTCNHNGLVERGRYLWNYMKESRIIPGPKHYSCMISLLTRAKLLKEAEEMITEAPCSVEYLELWRNLLSSCVENRNLELGIHAAEQILKLEEEDSAAHILLSNLYAATGKWDCVAEMRRKIRKMMLEKDPGLSWIEDRNNVHVFSSGDRSHWNIGEAQLELQRLQGNLTSSQIDQLEASVGLT